MEAVAVVVAVVFHGSGSLFLEEVHDLNPDHVGGVALDCRGPTFARPSADHLCAPSQFMEQGTETGFRVDTKGAVGHRVHLLSRVNGQRIRDKGEGRVLTGDALP
jgi:hypothetical protein